MYTPFYRSIEVEGWLRRQLEIQASGLSGHLHEVWPDVRDSAWIGGACEGWERVPYWLDGFIPLAHLLDSPSLISTARRYVHAIIDRQQEDGWICPCSREARVGYDAWAVLLIGKVLALHCEFEEDPAVETALRRAMRNLHDLLAAGDIRLFDWGKFRWYEGFVPLIHLYARSPEPWMLDLACMLREQGADYPAFAGLWTRPMNKWTFETHIVNLCMMLKYEAVCAELLGEPVTGKAEELLAVLERCNGTAVGTISGDECLSGLGNNQGTELCAVVELMYAYEWLYAVTGESKWADRLEKAAFNALPATFTDDMWAHQYDQQVNQIACQAFPGKSFFRTNNSEAHLFGLEPHYGCCTANFSQGWPKLALSALQRTERGVVIAHLLPVSIRTHIGGSAVRVRVQTDYPFRMQAFITIEADAPAEFDLSIRIPAWAKAVQLDGKPVRPIKGHLRLTRRWQAKTCLSLTFSAAPRMAMRPGNLRAVEYGPLVFALPIAAEYRMKEYTADGVERRFPYCDYELLPRSAWNYGFAAGSFTIREQSIDAVPFSSQHPPLLIEAEMAQVRWDYAEGYDSVAAARPAGRRAISAPERKALIPYGCAKLRMTEMPPIRK
ncbi:MAG: glycoside hydrolase family 127 protein [Clostridia bacterium]|nr:glycoside hydrolase family 127 protein [Clostridia bacterium]